MEALKIIFLVSLFLLIYSYLGYGLILACWLAFRKFFFPRKRLSGNAPLPSVALIVCAYDEEDIIEQKIRNTLELNYPPERLRIVFVTDGSSDRTPEIVRRYRECTLLHQPDRRGKSAAMNRATDFVTEEILVFCDANSFLNPEALTMLVRHYADPQVGGVAGEKRVVRAPGSGAVLQGEGLYWRYESLLKKLDAELYSVTGAAGELFSLRRSLYRHLDEEIILEDFVLSLRVCMGGYRIRYEPGAYAMEAAPASMREEQKRKIRISAGAFQAMGMLKGLFNIGRYGILSFQYISHRVLRWTLCPVCLLLVLASNVLLYWFHAGIFYSYSMYAQALFYLFAITGGIAAAKNVHVKALFIPYYFLYMNITVYIGFFRYVTNGQPVLWEKAKRTKFN